MTEKPIQSDILLAGSTATSRLWRNVVGAFELKDGRVIRTGLAVGSSDLIGLTAVTVGPEHVGRTLAVFTAIEVKHKARTTAEQAAFVHMIQSLGGFAGIARSVEDYRKIIANP